VQSTTRTEVPERPGLRERIHQEDFMRPRLTLLAVIGASIFSTGCASIIHNGPRTIPVASDPPGARVSIYDRSNKLVATNTTPFIATLPTKYGYFKGQNYRLVFDMPGYASSELNLDSSVSGWYFGNLVFGGLIGMVIVDPLTGAMYNLSPDEINHTLAPAQARLKNGNQIVDWPMAALTDAEKAARKQPR
jgi:hypothetical protein